MGLGLEKTSPSKKPLVYPLKTFDMDLDEMTSREIFEDVYADFRTHQSTYKDKQLVECFHNSIVNNSHLFKDRVVLEIGCGMGLLSLFCAQAGAKHVISVDCSVITQLTEIIVKENNMSDVITVIRSRIEDVKQLPHGIKKVDIIVSNWMGHSLYLDTIINAIIFARDKFLQPNGLILPDRAELYCVAANDGIASSKYSYWHDVYGFDMEPIQRDWSNIAKFHTVPDDKIMTDPVLVHCIDLNTCKLKDTNFNLEFTLVSTAGGFINSLVIYFKTYFLDGLYTLDTSPLSRPTHWAQTVLFIDKTIVVPDKASLLCNLELIRLRDKQNSVQFNLAMDYFGYAQYFFEKKYILSFY
uniref:type I protein arginine methyltransferase n=2 Tax=Cacopsylla melanoneura TaxID=428564 RepID=A0A8D8Z1L4_9HEMI